MMVYRFKVALCWLLFSLTLPLSLMCWLLDKSNRHQHAFSTCAKALSLVPGVVGRYLRTSFYKLTLDHCHYDLSIDFCSFFSKRQARIGRNVVIGSFSIIGKAVIGDNTLVASRVSILSGKHQHGSTSQNTGSQQKFVQLQIGQDSWVGENAIIMANTGSHCIVSAGSVVSKPMPDHYLAVGNPARFTPRATIADITEANISGNYSGNSKKVLHLVHFRSSNFIGGPEKQIISHLFQLSREKPPGSKGEIIRRTLISFDEPGGQDLANYCKKLDIECILLPPSIKSFLRARKYLDQWLSKNTVDVVCCHDYKSSFYSLSLREKYHYKVIGFSRGATAENLKVRAYMWLDNYLMRYMDAIVAVAQSQADLLSKLNIHNPRLKVIENASTATAFSQLDVNSNNCIYTELNIDKNATLILSAGRLSAEKGHRFLIQAFASLSKQHNDCHLILAGDGPLLEELRAASQKLNLKNIHFLGFRKDIVNLYQQCEIMALPSLSEGLPNAVLEAMTFGCCVVASAVGGVPNLIAHQHNGLLCDAADSDQIAEALGKLLNDDELRSTLKTNAKKTIAARYNPETQTEKLVELYHEVNDNAD